MTSLFRNHDLSTFLEEKRTTNSKDVSLTGMDGEFKGKCAISDEDYPKFYDLLHDYLFIKHGTVLNLIERHKDEIHP